jgi:hypothetical protein
MFRGPDVLEVKEHQAILLGRDGGPGGEAKSLRS